MICEEVPYSENGDYGTETRGCINLGAFTEMSLAEIYAQKLNDDPKQNDPDSDDFDPERFFVKTVKIRDEE